MQAHATTRILKLLNETPSQGRIPRQIQSDHGPVLQTASKPKLLNTCITQCHESDAILIDPLSGRNLAKCNSMLILSKEDVKKIFDVNDAIECVEESFRELGSGRVTMSRSNMNVPKHTGTFLTMSAYLERANALGVKIVTAYKDNPSRFNVPTLFATIVLSKPETGEVVSVMDGSYITALRTAAASAVATKYLAREDSQLLGIIGTGVQGRSHLAAISKVRSINKCLAYDIDRNSLLKFESDMSKELGIEVVRSENSKQVVTGSDIIVAATTSSTPVVKGEWLRKGTHVNSIMSMPTMRELDDAAISSAKIVVDNKDHCIRDPEDLVIPLAKGIISEDQIVELGDIVVGKEKGRTTRDQITIFKPVGLPSHDVISALKVYEKAKAGKLGQPFNL